MNRQPLPRITVAIVDPSVAQLVIPGNAREVYALAFRIAGRALELLGDGKPWSMPHIGEGRRGTCVVVRIEGDDDSHALDLVDALADAAISAARDAALVATHRVERV